MTEAKKSRANIFQHDREIRLLLFVWLSNTFNLSLSLARSLSHSVRLMFCKKSDKRTQYTHFETELFLQTEFTFTKKVMFWVQFVFKFVFLYVSRIVQNLPHQFP